MQPAQRPTGVKILAIISAINILGLLSLGIILGVESGSNLANFPIAAGLLSGILRSFAIFSIALSLIWALLTYGLWVGKGWAWPVAVTFAAINVIFDLLIITSLVSIVPLALNILALYYITTLKVKLFFGKESRKDAAGH